MFPKRKHQINVRFTTPYGAVSVLAVLVVSLIGLAACASALTAVPTFTPFAAPSTTSTSAPAALVAPTATETAQSISTPTTADTGWQGEYFTNETWQGPAALTRVDPEVVFDWQVGSPDPSIPVEFFSVRWTRCLNLEERYYIFTANPDDYVRVLMDDILVLDTPTYSKTEIPFAVMAGPHCIKVEYQEFIGNAYLNFSFQPGEPLPAAADASTAWQGEYFNNRDLQGSATFTRNDPAPQFDWKLGNPAPGLPIDSFSVRWTRCLDMEGGDYTFTAQADDFVRVLVDDGQTLEALASANAETTVSISAGHHCIKVEYRDDQGPANVNVSFR